MYVTGLIEGNGFASFSFINKFTGSGRIRSNTAMRIDKLKQEKMQRSKVKSIKWKQNDSNIQIGMELVTFNILHSSYR